jgi:hypothetical protein
MVRKVREVELRGRFRVGYELGTITDADEPFVATRRAVYEVVKRADVSIQNRWRNSGSTTPTAGSSLIPCLRRVYDDPDDKDSMRGSNIVHVKAVLTICICLLAIQPRPCNGKVAAVRQVDGVAPDVQRNDRESPWHQEIRVLHFPPPNNQPPPRSPTRRSSLALALGLLLTMILRDQRLAIVLLVRETVDRVDVAFGRSGVGEED